MSDTTGSRKAGFIHGLLLIGVAWVAPMSSVLFAPVLPQTIEHFKDVSNAQILAPVALVTPALFVGLLSLFAGSIADRIGRRKILLATLCVYAAVGMAPIWLDNLYLIVATRALLGTAEAAIMTVSTALIGDYFAGERRASWLAAQIGSAAIVAVVCFGLAGALGNMSWRAPFGIYGTTIIFLPLVWIFIFEPQVRGERAGAVAIAFPWQNAVLSSAITVFCGILFYITPVHVGLLLAERGITEPATIGLVAMSGSVGVVVGAALFRFISSGKVGHLLFYALLLSSAGLIAMYILTSLPGMTFGMFLNNVGAGMSLPILSAWALSRLPLNVRGRGSGMWTAAFFIGQFLSPLAVAGMVRLTGGTYAAAFAAFSAIALAAAALAFSSTLTGILMAEPAVTKETLNVHG